MRKKRSKKGTKEYGKLVRLSGRPLDLLEDFKKMHNGRRSYTEILEKEWVGNIETPIMKLAKVIDELENIGKTYYNPGLYSLISRLRPILLKSARGNPKYDVEALVHILDTFLNSQISKEADAK